MTAEEVFAHIRRYRIHCEEHQRVALDDGDERRYRAYSRSIAEVDNILLWVNQGVMCKLGHHPRCREVTP